MTLDTVLDITPVTMDIIQITMDTRPATMGITTITMVTLEPQFRRNQALDTVTMVMITAVNMNVPLCIISPYLDLYYLSLELQ